MKKIFFLAVIFSLFSLVSFSENELLGTQAKEFTVRSGDNKELSLSDVKGKVIILFYESKDTTEKNRKLKTELDKFYDEQPAAIKNEVVRLAVVSCKNVIFSGAWKSSLRENSQKEGLIIYGDWDGKMALAYRAKGSDSNFFIIDKRGVIRYYNYGSIDEAEIVKIKSLLKELTNEK